MISSYIRRQSASTSGAAVARISAPGFLMSYLEILMDSWKLLEVRRWQSASAARFLNDDIERSNKSNENVIIHQTTDGRGWGVFAKRRIPTGHVVMSTRPRRISHEQHTHSIQVGWHTHVLVDVPAVLVNHICGEANVGIRQGENMTLDFVALCSIEENSEVLWDYECSEYEMDNFTCRCGSAKCRGVLKGFKEHGQQILEAYGRDYIAPYLLTQKE